MRAALLGLSDAWTAIAGQIERLGTVRKVNRLVD
jgi:hypothetical protein